MTRIACLVTGNNIHVDARSEGFAGAIAIADGRVAALVGKEDVAAYRTKAEKVVDAGDLVVMPGLVDGHVHLRDPGQTHKEDFESGTRAAAAGGVTTVIAQPNTNPEIASREVFEEVKKIGASKSAVDFAIAARLDPARPDEGKALAEAGAASFEVSTNQTDAAGLLAVLAQASGLPQSVGCYCEDAALARHAFERAKASGLSAPDAYLAGHPPEVETAAAAHLWYLARRVGARILFRQVSCAETLAFFSAVRQRTDGFAVEVNPHHLALTAADVERAGTRAKVKPPLRDERAVAALWAGLAGGAVDLVGTDHAPHAEREKDAEFDRAPPGFPGLETLLPVLLDGAAAGRISLSRLIEIACEFPARWFGLQERKGSLAPGKDADLILVDPKKAVAIDAARMQTKARSPFHGRTLTGRVVLTMSRGEAVWEDGRICGAAGRGRFLPARFGGCAEPGR